MSENTNSAVVEQVRAETETPDLDLELPPVESPEALSHGLARMIQAFPDLAQKHLATRESEFWSEALARLDREMMEKGSACYADVVDFIRAWQPPRGGEAGAEPTITLPVTLEEKQLVTWYRQMSDTGRAVIRETLQKQASKSTTAESEA